MRKSIYGIATAVVFFLIGCQHEETVSPRNYPFIQSIDVNSIDETGAIVEFEVLKEGKIAIESYGVEFLEESVFQQSNLPKEYLVIETQGAPGQELISYKLKYDLKPKVEYLVKPFVRSGNTTIYGESIQFYSKGVNAPIISDVSINEISGSTQFKITGDYFSSVKDQNLIEIPFIEEYFNIEIISSTHQELTVELTRNSRPMTTLGDAYDLKLTVMGKSVTLPEHFTFGYPKIETINTLAAHVGQEILVTIDREYEGNLILSINEYPTGNYHLIELEKINPTTYKGTVSNYLAGSFDLKLVGNDFIYVYPQKFEIKESWKFITDSFQHVSWPSYQMIPAGNKLVFWRNDLSTNYYYDPLSNGITELPAFPGAKEERNGVYLLGTSKSELFVGFGYKILESSVQPYLDLWKLDLNTLQWKRMDDLPLGHSFLHRFFEYQNNIIAVSNLEKKYLQLDPISCSWKKLSFDVPEIVKSNIRMWAQQDYIYYFQERTSYLVLWRFRLGEQPELFGEFPTLNSEGLIGLKIIGNEFYLSNHSDNYSIDLLTKKVSRYQTIFFNNNDFPIEKMWGLIPGKPYTFPLTSRFDSYDFRMYQLNLEN